jgi:AcrR family transcriptional regulator
VEIKDKIIEGSQKMFVRYGIRSITMDMIAEQLGISKRTIYENFKDKDELLKRCIETGMSQQKKIQSDILKDSANVIEAMLRIVNHNVKILNSINPIFFYDIKKYYQEGKNSIEHNDRQNLSQIVDLLERGIREGLFRSAINVEIVANLFFEQFRIMNNQDVFPEERFSKAEIFENIVINFMRGIATEEGLSLIIKYSK